jgi:hypothetical protein
VTHTFLKYFLFKNLYIYIYIITRNIKKYINLIFFKLNIIIKSTQTQLKKKTVSLPVFVLCLCVLILTTTLLSSSFVLLFKLSTWLPLRDLSFSFFSLLNWVCGTDGTHRQLLLIAWVWSFVVFVPLILLLCKSFPLMICFFF